MEISDACERLDSAVVSSQVQDTSFILCIVYVQPEIPVKQLKNLNTAPSSKLLYHRLDLLGQPSSCLHFKQLATVGKTAANLAGPLPQTRAAVSDPLCFPESPTVMLAAGSFSSPYEHLSQPETKRMVEHYTAYLSDNTRLIANPGLKVPTHAHLRGNGCDPCGQVASDFFSNNRK